MTSAVEAASVSSVSARMKGVSPKSTTTRPSKSRKQRQGLGDGMAGAELFLLHDDFGGLVPGEGGLAHLVAAMADDDDRPLRRKGRARVHRVVQERRRPERVQNLG